MVIKACLDDDMNKGNTMRKLKAMIFPLCLLLYLGTTMQAWAAIRVNVVGLFSNKAIVMINGKGPYSLTAGQTKQGVKLLSANSNKATLVIEGKRQVIGMGQAASIGASSTTVSDSGVNKPVNLYADSAGHFFGSLSINGASLKYLVDTGATSVAMNSGDAKYARINYKKGRKIRISTANGVAPAYQLVVNTLKVGTIALHHVEVVVTEGGSPPFVLLGMSAQNRLDMNRKGSILTMTKKY